ncbi:hypothetical protein, partial [Kitasatospora sp. NPDC094015]|uniref:hypothetical protein n=1 Tax=Kitasatospora sp. NPDC094015 TaxID=3155205 RepID=UPI00331D54DE
PTTASTRLRTRYGAHPLHLLLMAGCFALAAYAAQRLLTGRSLEVALWFIGGALLHDLVLVPLYSGADLTTRTALAPRTAGTRAGGTGLVNHVRVPAFLSLLLLLVWFPLVLDLSEPYPGATALSETVYLTRWLLITAALFTASALLLAGRLLLGRAGRHDPAPPRPHLGGPAPHPETAPRGRRPVAPPTVPPPTGPDSQHRGPAAPTPAAIGALNPKSSAAAAAVVLLAAAAALVLIRLLVRRALRYRTDHRHSDPQGPRP